LTYIRYLRPISPIGPISPMQCFYRPIISSYVQSHSICQQIWTQSRIPSNKLPDFKHAR